METLVKIYYLEEATLIKLNFEMTLKLDFQEQTSQKKKISQIRFRLRGESSQTRGSPQRGNGKSTASSIGLTGLGADSASKDAAQPIITEEYPRSGSRLPSVSTTSSAPRTSAWP